MRKKHLPLLSLFILGIILGILFTRFLLLSTSTSKLAPITNETAKEHILILKQKNSSRMNGTAILTEKSGKVHIDIQMHGGTESAYSTHIRNGICKVGEMNEFKYNLNSIRNGQSKTIFDMSMKDFANQFPLLIIVHNNQKLKVACGDTDNSNFK